MCQTSKSSNCENTARKYLTLSGLPGVELPCDEISRIDSPPVELPDPDDPIGLPFTPLVVKAIRVLMRDGRVFWSSGDRSWYEREARKQWDRAVAKYCDAHDYLRQTQEQLRLATSESYQDGYEL